MTEHLDLYLIEGALLGAFMVSACACTVVMFHPRSPPAIRVRRPLARRAVVGLAMAATAVLLITSPWGRRSGAHMNPAVTLAFTLLGKVDPRDAVGYIAGQFAGGVGGVLTARLLLGPSLAEVRYAVTQPGPPPRGAPVAFAAELTIAFILFATVLVVSNLPVTMAYTPIAAAGLVFLFITFEAPLSGMSLNPARTVASAVVARTYRGIWIYLLGPPLGMIAAAGVYAALLGTQAVHCARLDHRGELPCPFHCTIEALGNRPIGDGIEHGGGGRSPLFSRP